MSKILALGAGPLPEAGVRHLSAHCLRTWSLIEPLRRSGHEIALYTLPIFPENPSLEQGAGLEEASSAGCAAGASSTATTPSTSAR